MNADEMLKRAMGRHEAGALEEAEAVYREVLRADPRQAEALHALGVLMGQRGEVDEAIQLIERAIAVAGGGAGAAVCYTNLGTLLMGKGEHRRGVAAARRAVELAPGNALFRFNLGNALMGSGDVAAALEAFESAIGLYGEYEAAHANRVAALEALGRRVEAVAAARVAAGKFALSANAHFVLGNALQAAGDLDGAAAALERAVALDGGHVGAGVNLGALYKDVGEVERAVGQFRAELARTPMCAAAHSSLLYALHFDAGATPEVLLREHREFSRQAAGIAPLQAAARRENGGPLRVGYVSPDFRDHIIGQLMAPVLERHDRTRVAVTCYDLFPVRDEIAMKLRGAVGPGAWRECATLSDEQLAGRIRADGIDVLVDLTLHMNRNRILMFARRPASVQVTWLAYPGGSGLGGVGGAFDFRLSDPFLDPPGAERFYVEETVRLPRTFWCWRPRYPEMAVSALPAERLGHITFGCFNHFGKVNAGTLLVWAEILRAVPGSRLAMLCPEGKSRDRVRAVLGEVGGRVEFFTPRAQREYLGLYHGVDIALDTFPYNGHTTSLDALWMGVPVVTRAGATAVSRAGLSQLSNVGHSEWVTESAEEYVACAVNLARDVGQLKRIRQTLRGELEASAICDAAGFTRELEAVLLGLWEKRVRP